MNWLNGLLIGVQVTCAVAIIFLILLQHGKGADMGAAFGGGASGSLFGASGSANFLSRTTAVLAAIFFLTTIGMAYTATVARTSSARTDHAGVMSNVGKDAPAPATAPSGAPSEIPATAAPASTTPPAAPATGNSTPAKPSDIPK
jgi:preprotein translocase subunit SecG